MCEAWGDCQPRRNGAGKGKRDVETWGAAQTDRSIKGRINAGSVKEPSHSTAKQALGRLRACGVEPEGAGLRRRLLRERRCSDQRQTAGAGTATWRVQTSSYQDTGWISKIPKSGREMFRLVLGIVFFLTSAGLIAASTLYEPDSSLRDILGNLGTEIFGILVTIALVDWFLERRRRQDRARELAWGVLHGIEHAVWVWQGGPRQLGTNELLGIIAGIRKQTDLEPFTEGLFLNVGLHARSILQRELSALKSLPGLPAILQDLVSLAGVRDLPTSTRIRTTAEILEASVTGLARVLGQSTDRMPAGLIWYQDPTPQGQEKRYRQVWSTGFPQGADDFGFGRSDQIPAGSPAPDVPSRD
jgi:hypothetical protein